MANLCTEASGAVRGWQKGPRQTVGRYSPSRVQGGQASLNATAPPRPASEEGKCDLRVTQQPKYLLHQPLEFKEFSPEKILILEDVTQAQLTVLHNGTLETRNSKLISCQLGRIVLQIIVPSSFCGV